MVLMSFRYFFIKDMYFESLNVLKGDDKNGWIHYVLFTRLPPVYTFSQRGKEKVTTFKWEKANITDHPPVFYPSVDLFKGSHKIDVVEEIDGNEFLNRVIVDNL